MGEVDEEKLGSSRDNLYILLEISGDNNLMSLGDRGEVRGGEGGAKNYVK